MCDPHLAMKQMPSVIGAVIAVEVTLEQAVCVKCRAGACFYKPLLQITKSIGFPDLLVRFWNSASSLSAGMTSFCGKTAIAAGKQK